MLSAGPFLGLRPMFLLGIVFVEVLKHLAGINQGTVWI